MPFFIYFIFGATIASFVLYKRTQISYLKVLFPFLIFVSLVEILGAILKARDINNHWLYNIYIILEFCVIFYLYDHTLDTPSLKKVIRVFALLFVPFALWNVFFFQTPFRFNTYTYIAGGIFTVILTILYFRQILRRNLSVSFVYDPMFWVSAALLFFYLGCLPFFITLNYLNEKYQSVAENYYIISQVLIALRYTFFIIGFLWKRPVQA